jgi:hypothetical protein
MITNSNSLKLQSSNSFAFKDFEFPAMFNAMNSRQTGGKFAPTAIRLRAVRRASFKPDKKGFAEFVGLTGPQLSNFENGYPISRMAQDKIVEKFPWANRSWLIDGNEGALTGVWAQRLLPLVEEESDRTLPRRRSPSSPRSRSDANSGR